MARKVLFLLCCFFLVPVSAEATRECVNLAAGTEFGSGSMVVSVSGKCDVVSSSDQRHRESRFRKLKEGTISYFQGVLGKQNLHVLYRYQLSISNKSKYPVELVIFSWDSFGYISSPFVSIAESFAIRVKACSKVVMEFFSYSPPTRPRGQVAAARLLGNSRKTNVARFSLGNAVVIPKGGFFYADGKKFPDEKLNEGCKS